MPSVDATPPGANPRAPFEVLVLGAGDAFALEQGSTALLLSCDGEHLALECPDRYGTVLRDAQRRHPRGVHLGDIERVLVSHAHGDHINGLEGLAFYRRAALGGRLELIASPELLANVWDGRLAAAMGTRWDRGRFVPAAMEDYFATTALRWDEAVAVGPFTIRSRRTRHHLPTSALLISAGGRTLGYSSDTLFDPELIAWLQAADLILHEVGHGPPHASLSELEALPPAQRARLRLLHYPDDLPASAIARVAPGDLLVV